MTNSLPPQRNYKNELELLAKKDKAHPGIAEIELALATGNPVGAMPLDAFIDLLALVVHSTDFCVGRAKTKTAFEMRLGLCMLMGEKTDRALGEPFDWASSIEFLGPFVAFIYQRMHAEVRQRDVLHLPP